MQGRAVEMGRLLCWYCKEAVLTGNKWGFVLLTSKSCTMLMLPSSITDVLGIIMDLEHNADAGDIRKLHINVFLSGFNTSVKYVRVGIFGVCVLSCLQYQLHWVGDCSGMIVHLSH